MSTAALERINLPRAYALTFGLMFLFTGIAAVVLSGGLRMEPVMIFPMNLPHGIVHIGFGSGALYSLIRHREVQYVKVMTAILSVLFLAGNLPQPLFGVLPIGGPDMFLHGMSGLAAGYALREHHWRAHAAAN